MKKIHVLALSVTAFMLLGSGALLFNKSQTTKETKADATTDMDAITPDNGEQLDKAHMVFDDFSTGLDTTNMWVTNNKAWGNKDKSLNNGVVPENVYYNSTDHTVIFRALGDYCEDVDFNYKLDDYYGYAHDGSTGAGRVWSKDGKRTGGTIKTRETYGPGRFEARFKTAPVEGVCTAFWTYNYGDSDDPNNNYNEIDFELPTYSDESNKDNLSFNKVIYTTYKTETEGDYKSQHTSTPGDIYLNDNQFHTYCIDWYYSNNTKKVNWFIDGQLAATWNNADHISSNVGRTTLGVWIPGRDSFCGIPNFDKAYMELDYFKYTPFKNQTYTDGDSGLGVNRPDVGFCEYSTNYRIINSSPIQEFNPNGSFNQGIPSSYVTEGNVVASKSYNYSGEDSYGIKIAGQGGSGSSSLCYINPNVKGIQKVKVSFKYKGYGSMEFYSGDSKVYSSSTLASPGSWSTFTKIINLNSSNKTCGPKILSESNDVGLIVDDLSITFPDDKTLDEIVTTGQTTQFSVGNTFTYDGTCTAHYSNNDEVVVTPTVDSSGVNMNAAGVYTVNLSYEDEYGSANTSYQITVATAPTPEENLSSYSFFTKNNGETDDGAWTEKVVYPDLDNSHPWQLAKGKYYHGGSDTINTIAVAPASTVMSSTSGSFYYPFKTCLLANSICDESEKVGVFAMKFDIENFVDVEVSLYSYSDRAARRAIIMYSVDHGTNWDILTNIQCNKLKGDGELFKYNLKASAGALEGETVRLAFVGTDSGGGGDAFRVLSVTVNNLNCFKNALDGATCNADADTQRFLAHQYGNMSEDDLANLNTTTMKYYNQTYQQGYDYLLTRWSKAGNGSIKVDSVKENNIVIVVATIISVVVLISFGYCVYRKRIRN